MASDRVTPTEFYGFSGGTFYVSTNSGATFTATAATGLPTSGTVFIKAMPGHAGDIWLAGGSSTNSGIWHSTNSGATFTKLANVSAAQNIGFGKAAPGQTYMALYTIATIGGVQGIFRSDDAGANWIQINDSQHQWGNIGQAITGDPRVYGQVYVGTNGRGIIYGNPAGNITPSPTPTATSASPTPTATSPSPSPSPTATSPSPSPSPDRDRDRVRHCLPRQLRDAEPVGRRVHGQRHASTTPGQCRSTAGPSCSRSPVTRRSPQTGTPPSARAAKR